jgi:putative transcriptional regulator
LTKTKGGIHLKQFNIRAKRKELGYSLEVMARRVGISKQYLSDIEIGKKTPSLYVALKIASVLNGTVENFFGQESA